MTDRRFRLAAVLAVREAFEEQQKRKVQDCRITVDSSADSIRRADDWLEVAPLQVRDDDLTGAELIYANQCCDAMRVAREKQKSKHQLLVEHFDREMGALRRAHQEVEVISVLRDQHQRALEVEDRRREQKSSDEDFRMSKAVMSWGAEFEGRH